MRINLLPHRETARRRRRDHFHTALGLAVLLGLLIAAVAYAGYRTRMASQQAINRELQTEIGKLDAEIGRISTLRSEIAALRARQQAVEDLQGERNLPVQLLDELAQQMPDGVYLTSLRQDHQWVTLQGAAQSNERVSELLRNLGSHGARLARPELVEITSATLAISPRDARRVANFTLRIGVQHPEGVQRAAHPAKAAAPVAAER